MFNKNYTARLIGAFIFVFGLFFLLLSITNIFNDMDFINQYNKCIEVSKYNPDVLDSCKKNVSLGIDVVIRDDQVELTTGQRLKIYIREILQVLFAIVVMIIGDYIFSEGKKTNKTKSLETINRKKPKRRTTKKRK